MENTLVNKAKFFGQYFGIHCLRHEELPNISALPITNIDLCRPGLEAEYLELKPLSSISDEDAIEVAKITCPVLFFTHKKGHVVDRSENGWITVKHPRNIKSVDIDFDGYVCVCNEDVDYERNPYVFNAIRKLQELGYYIGNGSEIDYGWVKLKGE